VIVLVDCRQLDLRQARGLENFALAVIEGLAGEVDSLILDVPMKARRAYEERFSQTQNITIIYDPIQAFFCWLKYTRPLGLVFHHAIRGFARLTGFDLSGRRQRWARRAHADVVFYPSHRDIPQHRHLPFVSTVHALLPDYGEREISILKCHIDNAHAIVVSWPYPFKELADRYPSRAERMFLIPYNTQDIFVDPDESTLQRFGLDEKFYFYPAVVNPRKNHVNLIKACAALRESGHPVPLIVCTGGGDLNLQAELVALTKRLGVADRVRFIGHLRNNEMAALYQACTATISCSVWEAGIAPLKEGASFGKPVLCSHIPPAVEHAKLLGIQVCFFDPANPQDIANKFVEFEKNFHIFANSVIQAKPAIHRINSAYVGYCYAAVLRYAASLGGKPDWAPYLEPSECPSRTARACRKQVTHPA
jgi:glycosyltransferase involved in cell wall biosynthesis